MKGMQTFDWLMLVMVIYVMVGIVDYSNMELQDMILVGCIIAWVIMLAVRVYIENFRNK